jgi:hypothetical protein
VKVELRLPRRIKTARLVPAFTAHAMIELGYR